MSRLTPNSWRPSWIAPEASRSKRSVSSAPVPTSVTRVVSASRSRSTRSWVPSSSANSSASPKLPPCHGRQRSARSIVAARAPLPERRPNRPVTIASCNVDLPASFGPTTRFMAGPKRRSMPCRLPKPSISIRVSRMPDPPVAAQRSFVEGIERQLKRSPDGVFVLSRLGFVVDELAHHLAAAGEFLSRGVEVMADARSVGNLEVGKSIAAFFRQRLRIQGEGSGALADQGGTDHRPVEVPSPPYRHHRFADMLRAGHAGDVNRLLGKLSRIDVIESDGQRALVVKGDQCRTVAAGFAPPQRLGAARIGDRPA